MAKYKEIEVVTGNLDLQEIKFNILYNHKTDKVHTSFFIENTLIKHSVFSVEEFESLDNCDAIKNVFAGQINDTPSLQLTLSGIEIARLIWLCNGKEKANLILGRTQIICSNIFDRKKLMDSRHSGSFKFVDFDIEQDYEFNKFLLRNNKLCMFSLFCNKNLLYTKMYKPYNSPLKFVEEDKEKIQRWKELEKTFD